MSCLHIVVRGRVQGVGFRWFVRETAQRLGVVGWVLNRADGGVEVAAEGDDTVIATFRELLARGPAGAEVTGLDEAAALSDPLPDAFIIKR